MSLDAIRPFSRVGIDGHKEVIISPRVYLASPVSNHEHHTEALLAVLRTFLSYSKPFL